MDGTLLKTVHARAPIRVNDIGGWTDTWFAGRGRVLNIAVAPAVEVRILVFDNPDRRKKRVRVRAENYNETFDMDPDAPRREPHPLLQLTLASVPIPADVLLEIRLFSPVPAGISTGTSAAVSVALLGGLDRLSGGGRGWAEIARLAQDIAGSASGLGLAAMTAAARGFAAATREGADDHRLRNVAQPIVWEHERVRRALGNLYPVLAA